VSLSLEKIKIFRIKGFLSLSLLVILGVYTISSCRPKSQNDAVTPDGDFPPAIANIIINKCATTGCHNAASYSLSANLLLDSWEHLFQGSISGSVVIPYCTKYSLLLYRVNTDSTLGLVIPPAQPPTIDPTKPVPTLSRDEYMTLFNWIQNGAPDKNGNVAFASDPDTRQKIYLAEQGCDLVSVIDAKSGLIMRYISVGPDSTRIDAPHSIAVSIDGMSAYVCYYSSDYIQKIDTRTDKVVATVNIGSFLPGGGGGSWGNIVTSPAADTALAVTNWQVYPSGAFVSLDANPLQSEFHFGLSDFVYPHGIAGNYAFDTLFIAAEYGNTIYRFSRTALNIIPQPNPVKIITLDGKPSITYPPGISEDPHWIKMSPDYSKYFVTCENSNEVRVMDAHTDTLIATIPVGIFPQEGDMSYNPATPYLFVYCLEDATTYPGTGASGSVYVINYNTYKVVQVIYGDFARPHQLAVDDRDGFVFINSTNSDIKGPPPHHATACGGRAGWYSIYKFGPNSFTPLNTIRYQTTVLPYSMATRFSTPNQ